MASSDTRDGTRSVQQNAVVALNNIWKTLLTSFPQVLGTSTTASAGAETLPANPAGFFTVTNPSTGETVKVPYYLE